MTDDEQDDAREAREDVAMAEARALGEARKADKWRWAGLILGTLLLITLAVGIVVVSDALRSKDSAQQSEQQTAVSIDQLCARNDETARTLRGAGLCDKAKQVQASVQPGKDGRDGVDGVPGRDGSPGKDGRDGSPGRPGSPGPSGPPGASGQSGVDGNDGAPGAPGSPGADGRDGADGADGSPGADGKDGAPGSPGPPGKAAPSITGSRCDAGRLLLVMSDGTEIPVAGANVCPSPTPTPPSSTPGTQARKGR